MTAKVLEHDEIIVALGQIFNAKHAAIIRVHALPAACARTIIFCDANY